MEEDRIDLALPTDQHAFSELGEVASAKIYKIRGSAGMESTNSDATFYLVPCSKISLLL